MKYADQLKSPKWQRKRLEIMNRDGWRCTKCKDENEQLQVHHSRYIRGLMAWDYPDHLLITLCHSCHKNEHFPATVPLTPRKKMMLPIKGYVIPWGCFREEGFPPLSPIPWSGETIDYPNSERNSVYICAKLDGDEWLVDCGSARGFLFPACGNSTKEWLEEIIKRTEEGLE